MGPTAHFTPGPVRVPGRAFDEQQPRVVPGQQGPVRARRPQPAPGLRGRLRREAQGHQPAHGGGPSALRRVDVQDIQGRAVLEGQEPLQDQRGRPLPPRGRAGRCTGPGSTCTCSRAACFAGAGIWMPNSATLGKIRGAIVENPGRWERIVGDEAFRSRFNLEGDSLKRAPKGIDPDHPLIELPEAQVLRRRDVIRRGRRGLARLHRHLHGRMPHRRALLRVPHKGGGPRLVAASRHGIPRMETALESRSIGVYGNTSLERAMMLSYRQSGTSAIEGGRDFHKYVTHDTEPFAVFPR